MIKLALRAEKARLLADKLGIIPHSESQWKWALRKLRPFVDKPKELAKAKERIGKLSNRERQLLQSAARKARLRQEVALFEDGKIIRGTLNDYSIDLGVGTPIVRAHTHPEYTIGPPLVSIARPSGITESYDYRRYKYYKPKLDKILRWTTVNLKNRSTEEKGKVKLKLIKLLRSRVIKKFKTNNLAFSDPYQSYGDMSVLAHEGKTHSILAPGIEGVHKYREKLPRAVRSVYFEGGL